MAAKITKALFFDSTVAMLSVFCVIYGDIFMFFDRTSDPFDAPVTDSDGISIEYLMWFIIRKISINSEDNLSKLVKVSELKAVLNKIEANPN